MAFNAFAADTNRYIEKKDGLFYVLEKITDANYESWSTFASTQKGLCNARKQSDLDNFQKCLLSEQAKLTEELSKDQPSEKKVKNLNDCVKLYRSYLDMDKCKTAKAMNDCFTRQQDVLRMFKKDRVTVWVGYVSPFHPHEIKLDEFLNSQIEMAITVATSDDLPMVMFMGISRVPTYMLDAQKTQHKALAKSLMAFIAGKMADHERKIYMSTVPLKAIYNLLVSTLTFVKTGDDIEPYMKQMMHDENHWIIHDRNGNVLFDGEAQQWSWFLEYTRFLTNKKILIDLNELKTHFLSSN